MTVSGSSAVLCVQGLRIRRTDRDSASTYTLDVPHFEARRGERIGIVGETGSGKSTFLELLGLLSWPDRLASYRLAAGQGDAPVDLTQTLLGRDAEALTRIRARCIGFVLQDGGLIPYLSVRENARLAMRLSVGLDIAAEKRIRRTADDLRIGGLLDRLPASLSGGQRQRAAVLRALAPGVPVLIGDEPTASLDAGTSTEVMEALVTSAAAHGATLVISSHNEALLGAFDFRICRVALSGPEAAREARLETGADAGVAA